MTRLGDQIREARKARRFSQRKLAERAGVAFTTVQRVERNENNNKGSIAMILNALNAAYPLDGDLRDELQSLLSAGVSSQPAEIETSDRLNALIQDDRDLLFASDIAPVLGVDANSIRRQADAEPAALGFPVIRVGSKTLIPRRPFIQYILGKEGTQCAGW